MAIYELLTSESLVTIRKKTHRKPAALPVIWHLKYSANRTTPLQLTTMHLVLLLMSAWWGRDHTQGRPDKKSEIRCFKSKCRLNNKTYHRGGQWMLLTSLISSFKGSVTRDSDITEWMRSRDNPGLRTSIGILSTPKVSHHLTYHLPKITLVKRL